MRWQSLIRALVFLFLTSLMLAAIAENEWTPTFWLTSAFLSFFLGFLIDVSRCINGTKQWIAIEEDRFTIRSFSGLRCRTIQFSEITNIRFKTRHNKEHFVFLRFRIAHTTREKTFVLWIDDYSSPKDLIQQMQRLNARLNPVVHGSDNIASDTFPE